MGPRRQWLLVAAMLAIASLTIASTYRVVSMTDDEPNHIACGLEFLDQGTYRLWPENPPLSRLPVAIGPYLAGHRAPDGSIDEALAQVTEQIDSDDPTDLALARLGVLPFLGLAGVLLFRWGRALQGPVLGLVALAMALSVPSVLAHAGLATTDVAFSAMFLASLMALLSWLEAPTWPRTLGLGAVLGATLATKFTALALVPCIVLSIAARLLWGPRPAPWQRYLARAPAVIVAGALAVWIAYGLSFGRPVDLGDPEHPTWMLDRCFSRGSAPHAFAEALVETPLPAPELVNGLLILCAHNARGHAAYLLGEVSQTGFRSYYPVAILAKAPIPLLVLAATGLVLLLRRHVDWRMRVAALAAAGLVVTCISGRINIGVRHVLPVFFLLALLAAFAVGELWTARRWRRPLRAMVLLLCAWQLSVPVRAYPDYIPYFNEAAALRSEPILLDSDLDWGQDLARLQRSLERREIGALHIAYFGGADLCRHRLPELTWLPPSHRVTGWVAVSEMYRHPVETPQYEGTACARDKRWDPPTPGGYSWLDEHAPVERIGRSIRLYHIEEPRLTPPAPPSTAP